jgi:hypothetical protein
MILAYFIFSILSAATYNMGGLGEPFKRWMRPTGGCLLLTASLWALFGWHWSLIIVCGLHYASLTGYYFKKGNAGLLTWVLTGLVTSLTIFPFIIFHHYLLWGAILRSVLITILTAISSELIGTDFLEEGTRGYVLQGSVPLLLIGMA